MALPDLPAPSTLADRPLSDRPFRPVSETAPHLIQALGRIATEHPLDRKVLVTTARGAGRELLRSLARARGGWTGFVVETPRPFALQLAVTRLAERGLHVLDEFEEEAVVDEALTAAVAPGGAGSQYGSLAGGPGFRRAVRGAVTGMRLAGVTPASLQRAALHDRDKQRMLTSVLKGVEDGLAQRSATDVAGVLELATEALRAGDPIAADRVYLVPGLSRRAAAGRFVEALIDRGAQVLATDPVMGLEPPSGILWKAAEPRTSLARLSGEPDVPAEPVPNDLLELPLFRDAFTGSEPPEAPTVRPTVALDPSLQLFHAAGVHEEVREVLRRVIASGRRFDEVELVTPDPAVYGPALHSLAQRLNIGVTFAVGLPVERTRPGRAVAAYLRWIGDDFPSAVLRGLLENDDLRAPGEHRRVNPRSLARTLRRLRIGWGRDRYLQAIERAVGGREAQPPEPRHYESADQFQRRLKREIDELTALQVLVGYLMRHTPTPIPKRLELHPRPIAPSALARGMGRFLRLVPTRKGTVDATAKERLLRILDRIEHTLQRPAPFGAALGVLREHLEIRVPAPRAEGKAPWLSDGGSLHLTDVEHGGLAGRALTFIVGLDAGRFPPNDVQDPLLLDRDRRALSEHLPTSSQRLEERRFEFAALLARVSGELVMSYPAWEAAEARVQSPSPVMLQAYRLMTGERDAGFDDLRAHLGTPTSRVPRSGVSIDREDVWLHALAEPGHLREGVETVREAFPRLDAGLSARQSWRVGSPGPHQGVVPPRSAFDPRAHPEIVLSASRLEALGTCPLRYFYRYVLRVWPPDDPEYRPDEWLSALHRGSLLHGVYETTLRTARDRGLEPDDAGFLEVGIQALRDRAARIRSEVPPPSEAVYTRELEALETDLRCFADHLQRHPAPWRHLERSFGMPGRQQPPVRIRIGGGRVSLRGAVDRVDTIAGPREGGVSEERLRIIDYKTGGFGSHWSRSTGTYSGGRRLQHLLYTLAVEALEERPVASMEYHFPTRKGQGEIRRFPREELRDGEELLSRLLDGARAGHFVPTDQEADCRFCDFGSICGVVEKDWGAPVSPRAAWGRHQSELEAEAYEDLKVIRGWED